MGGGVRGGEGRGGMGRRVGVMDGSEGKRGGRGQGGGGRGGAPGIGQGRQGGKGQGGGGGRRDSVLARSTPRAPHIRGIAYPNACKHTLPPASPYPLLPPHMCNGLDVDNRLSQRAERRSSTLPSHQTLPPSPPPKPAPPPHLRNGLDVNVSLSQSTEHGGSSTLPRHRALPPSPPLPPALITHTPLYSNPCTPHFPHLCNGLDVDIGLSQRAEHGGSSTLPGHHALPHRRQHAALLDALHPADTAGSNGVVKALLKHTHGGGGLAWGEGWGVGWGEGVGVRWGVGRGFYGFHDPRGCL